MAGLTVTILDPRVAPPTRPADAPLLLGRPLTGARVGLRLDHKWRSWFTVLDCWEPLLQAAGASTHRVVADVHLPGAAPGATPRADLDEWCRLVDCAVIGLGN